MAQEFHHYDLHMGNILLRNQLTGDKDDDQGDITAIDYGAASDDDAQRSTGDVSSGMWPRVNGDDVMDILMNLLQGTEVGQRGR